VESGVLRIYVAEHCGSCRESRRLARSIARRIGSVVVHVIDVDTEDPADEIFAVPTFCYDGKILFLGNPGEEELIARLLSLKQGSRSSLTLGAWRQAANGRPADLTALPKTRHSLSLERMPERRSRLVAACSGALGILGTLACSLSMVAPAAGLFAAHAARSSMDGMGGFEPAGQAQLPAWWTELVLLGPAILVTSVLVLAVAVAIRRRLASLPALVGGSILYLGMYAQPSLPMMYTAMALGIALLVLAYAAGLRAAPFLETTRADT
jgi:hypothetical protein